MTDEQREVDRSQWYVQVTAPGVPYSAIRVAFSREGVAEAVLMCKYLAQKWGEAFDGAREPEREPFHADAPRDPFHIDASREPQTYIDPETREAMVVPGEKVTGEHFACPDCGREAKPSVERYQQWEMGNDGRQYAQKWFCPNDACSTKSLWRSKLKPLQPVAAR